MLDVLMKFGAYRIDYLESSAASASDAVAFYLRANCPRHEFYSREAKHQLYQGLALIAANYGLHKLVGVYVDVNELSNINRPAYQRLKMDMLDGLFHKVFVVDPGALLGHPVADADMRDLYWSAGGFEIISMQEGYFEPLELCCGPLAA